MSELAETQRTLADLLRGASSPTDELAARIATGNPRLTAAMQLAIYREQFFMRHLDVLREDFGSIVHMLGAEAFETLGRAYLQAHPPRSFTLRDLGADLATFLATEAPWSDDALLAELARVEWAFVEAFDAPDAPPLDLRSVAALSEDAWPLARIVLHPHVQRLALREPAHDYRLAVRRGEPPAERAPSLPCWVIVFRGATALRCLDVEAGAFALLDELARGVPLGQACEHAATITSGDAAAFEADVGVWFQQWTALGLITRVVSDV